MGIGLVFRGRRRRLQLPAVGGLDSEKRRVCYFYDPEVGNSYYGRAGAPHEAAPHPHDPLAARALRPPRPDAGVAAAPSARPRPLPLPRRRLRGLFLRSVTPETQQDQIRALKRFNVGEDCPAFDGLYNFCQTYAGGSVGGAVKLNQGHDIAVNWPAASTTPRGKEKRRRMGSRVPFFLLLLLVVSWGAAEAQSFVVLDLETIVIPHPATIYKEQITESEIPVTLERDSPLCSVCENFTTEAVGYLSEKQTQDKIMEILRAACSQTFYLEQKCVELVDSYATLLFAKINEIQPAEICKTYGLCENKPGVSVIHSESICIFCRHLVDEVLSKLKDPDAEFEIIQMLLKECNKIEGHVQQCKRMVLQYIPLVLINGEKFLEKKDICATIQVCEADLKRSTRSFFQGDLLSNA